MVIKCAYLFVFDRKKQSTKKGTGLIELVVYFPQTKSQRPISTKVKVKPTEWNTSKRQINAKHPAHIALNQVINKLQATIEALEIETINKGRNFTKTDLNEYLKGKRSPASFNQFFERTNKQDMKLKRDTLRDHRRTLQLLNQFNKNISFSNLTYKLINGFDNYLHSLGFSQNTIWKHHKNLKKYITLAINYNLVDVNQYPYKNFKITRKRPSHVYLNFKEVEAIEQLDLSEDPLLNLVKIRFLASCYTGLRISDNARLSHTDFINQDGGIGLKLDRMYKVDRKVHLKLWKIFEAKPQTLLTPYIKQAATDQQKSIWPRYISDSDMNKHLKHIQQLTGINKHLTNHVARHTFGTLYARQTKSIFEVMKAMGISKFETARVYIDLSDEL